MDGSILVADTSNHRIRGSKNLATNELGCAVGGAVGMICNGITIALTLWWTNILPWKDPPFLMGKSTISMAIFHCYVSSPEGKCNKLGQNIRIWFLFFLLRISWVSWLFGGLDVTFWRFRISKLPSAGLDDPCCSGYFLVVDNLFNSWSFSNLHPFMHGLNWKIMQLFILFQSSSDAIFAIQSHAVPWFLDRHQGRINFQLTQIETVAGTGAKGLVRRWYSMADGSKPMKLPYDWGIEHPLTSYFKVPSGCQGFDS